MRFGAAVCLVRQSRAILPTLVVALLAAACGGDPALQKQQHFESGNRYFAEGKFDDMYNRGDRPWEVWRPRTIGD